MLCFVIRSPSLCEILKSTHSLSCLFHDIWGNLISLGTPFLFLMWMKLVSSFKTYYRRKDIHMLKTLDVHHAFQGNLPKNKLLFAAFGYFPEGHLAHDLSKFFSCPTQGCAKECESSSKAWYNSFGVCVSHKRHCLWRDCTTSLTTLSASQICATAHTYSLCITYGEHSYPTQQVWNLNADLPHSCCAVNMTHGVFTVPFRVLRSHVAYEWYISSMIQFRTGIVM